MRAMKSSLPIFIFIGLALFAIIGIAVLEAGAANASIAVNNTSTEDLAVNIYSGEAYILYGIGAILLLLAGYFALRVFT